ncbi:hypothetical protein [Bacteroides sp.]
MEITKELIEQKKSENPGCAIALVKMKDKEGKTVALETLIKSPSRHVISEADKWESTNPGKAKEIYVRNCVLTDVEQVMADDNLFYQAYFAVIDLLPFQKPDVQTL